MRHLLLVLTFTVLIVAGCKSGDTAANSTGDAKPATTGTSGSPPPTDDKKDAASAPSGKIAGSWTADSTSTPGAQTLFTFNEGGDFVMTADVNPPNGKGGFSTSM